MESKWKEETRESSQESGCISMKCEPEENDTKYNFHSFASKSKSEFSEINTPIKVEHCSESDSGRGSLTNITQPELVVFRRKSNSHQNPNQDHRQTVMFEKIPKIETEIKCDKPASSSYQEYDLYNIKKDCDNYANSEPELDLFADSNCDPSFSQPPAAPQSHTSNNSSATQEGSSSHLKYFKCEQCPSTILNRNGLRKHMKSKRNEKAIKCLMPNCKKALNLKSHVQDHLRIVHSIPNTSKNNPQSTSKLHCGLCLETQSSESALKTHVKTCAASHINRHRFCVSCNQIFSSCRLYSHHALETHGIKDSKFVCCESIKCEYCSPPYASKEDACPRPFKCQECPSTFANLSHLTHHVMKSHKSKRFYKCPMPHCEIVCKNNGNLQDHLRRDHSSNGLT